jgi:hypothetical protein
MKSQSLVRLVETASLLREWLRREKGDDAGKEMRGTNGALSFAFGLQTPTGTTLCS